MQFNKTLGILGSGQLAKMMAESANKLGISTIVYSSDVEPCSAESVKKVVVASFSHEERLAQFANECDFITIETENIPLETLAFLEKNFPEKIKASSSFISIAQNRLKEKQFAKENNIPTGKNWQVKTHEEISEIIKENGACILKTATQGYDGKGQAVINLAKDIPQLENGIEDILEQKIPFVCELSVVATKNASETVFFPIPRNIHKEGILRESIVPFSFDGFDKKQCKKIQESAVKLTKKIAEKITHFGTFAVEYFVLENGDILFNEMAPRPHNSGHYANDLCNISQFENHVRAVCNLPIINPKLLNEGKMVNIIGNDICELEKILDKPNHKIHLYNKIGVFNGRKLGHYNIIEK